MSSKPAVWTDVVRLRSRYQRSVHLERDAKSEASLTGYVITPLVRTLMRRIVEGFDAGSTARAWSITGPYGTGKSAFAVFLAEVMSPSDLESARAARKLLQRADGPLAAVLTGARGLFRGEDGLWPVLATGERSTLTVVLLRALVSAVEEFWEGKAKPALHGQVSKLLRRALAGQRVATREVVKAFEDVASKVAGSSLPGRGLVVILDEAGKALEYAAQHPDEGDVQLLQELAEAANRSGDAPIVFVVLLHQAFEQYAGRLSLTERGEWSKVQGRFEDLAFQETSHELLRLVGEALERRPAAATSLQAFEDYVKRAAVAISALGATDATRLEGLFRAALPLHPVTATLLGPLFRSRIAQNERSLFAFLGSNEPRGFQEFLATTLAGAEGGGLFGPDALYDYVAVSLGSRLDGHLGRQWAQIETALRRLPQGATDLDAKLVKTVGLLGLFGESVGLSASPEVLELTYATNVTPIDALNEALERLRQASLIVFRKFRSAYQLWEGSDIDVEALLRDALQQLDVQASLVQRMARVCPPRPVVARRHLHETGNFRYFELRYADASGLDDGFPALDPHADGGVILFVEANEGARTKLLQRLRSQMTWLTVNTRESKPYIVALPRHVGRLLEIGAELAALEWVQTHTPELQDDLVARREVTKRIADAEQHLRNELTRVLDGEVACEWMHNGEAIRVESLRDITRAVSDACDAAYSKAPHIHNELLNRRQLSSAAAGARRNLVEAMATRSKDERLGFLDGTPPEVSMYRSFLEHHGIHRRRDGEWSFGVPIDKRGGSLKPVWDALDKGLRDADESRVSLAKLFDALRSPPFGLKDGVLPVLLVAALLHWKDEIALYEDAAFVPALTGAVIERLLRQPERFEAQRLSISGPRAALHGRLMQTLTGGRSAPGIVPIVRQFVRVVAELPDFSRTTKSVSPKAQAVREVLLRAKEPAPLVFRDLPAACGLAPFESNGVQSEELVERYVQELRDALRELQTAYPRLLDEIEETVRTNLALPRHSDEFRRELAGRARRLVKAAVDSQLKAFLIRARDEEMPREEWLVSMGAFLAGKPPESWHDRDLDQLRVTVGLIARRFSAVESLPLAEHDAEADLPAMLRIAVMQPGVSEHERTVALRADDEKLVESLCSELRRLADSAGASLTREGVLAAVGLVARELITDLTNTRSAAAGASA